MRFKRIHTDEELYDGIWVAFHMDDALIEKYHILDNSSFLECVNDTYVTIKDATEKTICQWYHILIDETLIGYFVASKTYSFLFSFGINIEYRKPDVLEHWFSYVSCLLGEQFTCALWAKNLRAIEFLKRNGMKLYEEKENALIFKYN